MAATIYSAAVTGPDAELVTIETRIAPGLGYLIVVCPTRRLAEAKYVVQRLPDLLSPLTLTGQLHVSS